MSDVLSCKCWNPLPLRFFIALNWRNFIQTTPRKDFCQFVNDVLPNVALVSLPAEAYAERVDVRGKSGLDFDDAYQYKLAEVHNLEIVTMDQDFEKSGVGVKVKFL